MLAILIVLPQAHDAWKLVCHMSCQTRGSDAMISIFFILNVITYIQIDVLGGIQPNSSQYLEMIQCSKTNTCANVYRSSLQSSQPCSISLEVTSQQLKENLSKNTPVALWNLMTQTCPKCPTNKISTFKLYQQDRTLQICYAQRG